MFIKESISKDSNILIASMIIDMKNKNLNLNFSEKIYIYKVNSIFFIFFIILLYL